MAETPRLVDTGAVAKMLGMHPQTVRRLAQDGTIPSYRFATHYRFDVDAVKKVLEDSSVKPIPEGPAEVRGTRCSVDTADAGPEGESEAVAETDHHADDLETDGCQRDAQDVEGS